MRLSAVRMERGLDFVRLTGTIDWDWGGSSELYYRFPAEFAELMLESADPFLAALLPPCMMSGERLEIVPPVDAMLLRNVDRIQDILVAWNAGFHRVEVVAPPRAQGLSPVGTATVSLFSGGVDSFYTLVKASRGEAPVDYVLFMAGLEQPLEKSRDTEAAIALAAASASRFGARTIAGETNLRSLFPAINYERTYNSAALSSAALVLSGGASRLLIPSSAAYSQLIQWGSHPLLDELWSTSHMQVVHDGAEALRIDKLAFLAADREVLATLRVCVENASGPYNCGSCKKCERTMVGLEILGVRPQARLFPQKPMHRMKRLFREEYEFMLDELLGAARARHCDPALIRQLERALRRRQRRRALRELLSATPGLAQAYALAKRLRARLSGGSEPVSPPVARIRGMGQAAPAAAASGGAGAS